MESTRETCSWCGETVDRLPDQAIGAADVIRSLGRDRRRLDPEPRLRHGRRRLGADLVLRPPPVLEGEIEALEFDLQPDHLRIDHAQGLVEQLLPGLVALQHDYPQTGHRMRPYPYARDVHLVWSGGRGG